MANYFDIRSMFNVNYKKKYAQPSFKQYVNNVGNNTFAFL